MTNTIDKFTGKYDFLSNFYPTSNLGHGIDDEGRFEYPTVEHKFQAMKCLDGDTMRRQIASAKTPGQAKRLGRRVNLRPGWNDMRIDVMVDIIKEKFAPHTRLAQQLIDTAPNILIEGNTWNDRFWGVCRGKGRNELGKALMAWRSRLITNDYDS